MKKISLIINPIAGGRDNAKFARKLAKKLSNIGWTVEELVTKAAGEAKEYAKNKIESNSLIASVGGDGTFNEVASALVNTNAPLALIPCGSGNGLARMLGIPGLPNRIVNYVDKGSFKHIDVGTINKNFFFCTCGFGFDAQVARSFADSKERGLKTYIESTVQKAIEFKGVHAEFTLDGKLYKDEFMLVTFANANQYGNNAFIAPDASLNDGWLDVTIVRKFPKVLAGAVALALFTKQIDQFKFVECVRAKKVEILKLENNLFHRDGDFYSVQLPAKIDVLPKALNILTPPPNLIEQAEQQIKESELAKLFSKNLKF